MRLEWEPQIGQRVVDQRTDTCGRVREVVDCVRYGHFADPYWRADVRWDSGRVENIETTWLDRVEVKETANG